MLAVGIEALYNTIARSDREPRIPRERGILVDIEGVFNEVVGTPQIGRAETKCDRSSPTGAGILKVVSRVASQRAPKSRG